MKIILLGFKSAGKTTTGQALAQALDVCFYDSDEILLKKHPEFKTIQDLYFHLGDPLFRYEEQLLAQDILMQGSCVFSPGSGIVDTDSDISPFFKHRIFLDVEYAILEKRIDQTRYALAGKMKSYYQRRYLKYIQWSTIHLKLKNETTEEILNRVLKAIHE